MVLNKRFIQKKALPGFSIFKTTKVVWIGVLSSSLNKHSVSHEETSWSISHLINHLFPDFPSTVPITLKSNHS